jgi:hypothetical protein
MNNASKLLKFQKDQKLTKDDKKMQEYGIKTENGEYTILAMELVMQKILEENEKYFLELIEKMNNN